MRYLLFFSFLTIISFSTVGQELLNEDAQLKKIKEFEEQGLFKVDDENIITIRVIENIEGDMDEIYVKVKNYFSQVYNNPNSIIQTDEKEQGIIVLKSSYMLQYVINKKGRNSFLYKAIYTLRLDIKDNRIRVICASSDFNIRGRGRKTYKFIDYSPFTKESPYGDKYQNELLITLINTMNNSIDDLEKAVKEGLIIGENEDW